MPCIQNNYTVSYTGELPKISLPISQFSFQVEAHISPRSTFQSIADISRTSTICSFLPKRILVSATFKFLELLNSPGYNCWGSRSSQTTIRALLTSHIFVCFFELLCYTFTSLKCTCKIIVHGRAESTQVRLLLLLITLIPVHLLLLCRMLILLVNLESTANFVTMRFRLLQLLHHDVNSTSGKLNSSSQPFRHVQLFSAINHSKPLSNSKHMSATLCSETVNYLHTPSLANKGSLVWCNQWRLAGHAWLMMDASRFQNRMFLKWILWGSCYWNKKVSRSKQALQWNRSLFPPTREWYSSNPSHI